MSDRSSMGERILETPRALGEPLADRHERLLVRWWSDPEFTSRLGGTRPEAEVRARMSVAIAHWRELGYGSWIFRERQTGTPVGWAGLRRTRISRGRTGAEGGRQVVELYYAVDPLWRRRGFGFETASAVIEAAGEAGLDRLVAFILEQNRPSRGLAERLGFRRVGEVVHAELPHLLYQLDLTRADVPGVGLVGAGGFAQETLLPLLARHRDAGRIRLTGVITTREESARRVAAGWGFASAGAGREGLEELLADDSTGAVAIATRHDSHAAYAAAALRAGCRVLVEKPLALTPAGLAEVEGALAAGRRSGGGVTEGFPPLLVGFNRRFSPLAAPLVGRLRDAGGPFQVSINVNARQIPPGHWRLDGQTGGGRLLGHAVHFLDVARFLVGSPVSGFDAHPVDPHGSAGDPQSFFVRLAFADRSQAVLQYCSGGDPGRLGEQIWVGGGGTTAWVNNWAVTEISQGARTLRRALPAPDKGYAGEVDAFVRSLGPGIETGAVEDSRVRLHPTIEEQLEISRLAIEVAEALRAAAG